MMKLLTEYDYEPGEPCGLCKTYYLPSELKSKNDSAEIFWIILQYYIVTVHIQISVKYSRFMPLQFFKVKQ